MFNLFKKKGYFNFKPIENPESCVHGDHWDIMIKETEKDFVRIIHNLKDSVTIKEHDKSELPSGEPHGALLSWPTETSGAVYCIHIDKTGNTFYSAYPWFDFGKTHKFHLDEVLVWENRLEACISGSVEEDIPVTFFDPYFVCDRYQYSKEDVFDISLLGFVYHTKISNQPDLVFEGEELEQLDEVLQKGAVDGKLTISTNKAKIFVGKDTAADDYEFQGELVYIEALDNPLTDVKLWKATINLGNTLGDRDFILNIVISENSLENPEILKVGNILAGILWLQGCISE